MRFRLSTLLLAVAVVASSVSLAGAWGILLAAYMLLLVALVRAGLFQGNRKAARWLVALIAVSLLTMCLLPAYSPSRSAAFRAQCVNNLKQIALALHNYHDQYGRLPPVHVADKDGTPMHSWRVLILPYIEQSPLYKAYNLNEPWNGPALTAAARCGTVPWFGGTTGTRSSRACRAAVSCTPSSTTRPAEGYR